MPADTEATEPSPTPGPWMPAQESSFKEILGTRTAIYQTGVGTAVLLIHGSSMAVDSRLTWFRFAPLLSENYRVIAYDQPGFGISGVPEGARYPDRLERAEHAARLIEELDLANLFLVGHSEGGFIATWLAIHLPQRIAGLAIVASGGTAPALGSPRDQEWMQASAKAYDYLGRSESEAAFVESETRLAEREDPEFEAVLRSNFRQALVSGNVAMFREKARRSSSFESYTALQEKEIFPHIGKLKAPALLIWPGADRTVPVGRGEALAELIPGSEFHVIPNAGHWVMHDDATRFNGLMKAWLDRHSRADRR